MRAITMRANTLADENVNSIEVLVKTLTNAIRKHGRQVEISEEIEKACFLLETIPLTTDEFGLALSRLRNATRFIQSSEPGAAKWELQTLRNWLSFLGSAKLATPKLKLKRWLA